METVQQAFESYLREVVPVDASAIQIQECRRAFYGGALSMLSTLMALGEDSITEDQGIDIIEARVQECLAFLEYVKTGKG